MIDLLSLIVQTNAYKTVKGDKENGRLSHAYLLLTPDKEMLTDYLKIFAKLLVCEEQTPCMKCRACKLIDQNAHPDVLVFPEDGQNVKVEDVNTLIAESYVKALEGDKKVFVLSQGQTMNLPSQNKLLKTLEEPPKNVHIIIGATSEFPLLATVKSRVKKLEIPPFSANKLIKARDSECPDKESLKNAVACGDGTVGKALALYQDENLKDALDLAVDMLVNMNSSSQILDYSNKINSKEIDLGEFLSVLELLLRDMLVIAENKEKLAVNEKAKRIMQNAKNFSVGAIINALEKISQAFERKKFNANQTMLTEWVLFQILEGKYKWQKL